ncbi:hypothetical protein [Marinomonas sp.]|uniref:hypothetical protein n=1 Tax=Marinomonas sp. TaxID=1904862 RepID=UPI003BAD3F3A|tara:strand:- start:74261 stop:74851 length:591 start_codon:yes stop_codon:yes gene_type:complete
MPDANSIAITQQLTHGFQASDWIALSSVVIALCVFFTTLWQAWVSRNQAIINVRPLLIASVDQIESPDLMLTVIVYLENVGIGPAIIKSWSVYSDDQPIDKTKKDPALSTLSFAFTELKTPVSISSVHGSEKQTGFAMKAGAKDPILTIKAVNGSASVNRILTNLDRLKLVIEYQDLYQKKQPVLDTSKNKLISNK